MHRVRIYIIFIFVLKMDILSNLFKWIYCHYTVIKVEMKNLPIVLNSGNLWNTRCKLQD